MTLSDKVKRAREAMSDADVGPLVAAEIICDVVENWAQYRQEAGDVTYNTWLRREFGRGRTYAWFKRRLTAVQTFGESIRRMANHHLAVWMVQNIPQSQRGDALVLLGQMYVGNHRVPVTLAYGSESLRTHLEITPRAKHCPRCEILEAQLRQLHAAE